MLLLYSQNVSRNIKNTKQLSKYLKCLGSKTSKSPRPPEEFQFKD